MERAVFDPLLFFLDRAVFLGDTAVLVVKKEKSRTSKKEKIKMIYQYENGLKEATYLVVGEGGGVGGGGGGAGGTHVPRLVPVRMPSSKAHRFSSTVAYSCAIVHPGVSPVASPVASPVDSPVASPVVFPVVFPVVGCWAKRSIRS
jgi:hypothetical protein